MSDSDSNVKSEARGAHAVAWLDDAKQAGLPAPILVVGLTPEEAARHLRSWLAKRREQSSRQGA